jgi:Spy/CpxP family protein refolding chaperone
MFTAAAILSVLTFAADPAAAHADPAPPAGPLSGPKIKERERPRSIVPRTMEGRADPLETRPERVALEKLTLSDDERRAAQAIFDERAVQVAALARQHRETLLKLHNLRQARGGRAEPGTKSGNGPDPDRAEIASLVAEIRADAGPLLDPPLIDQLSAKLTPANAAELRRMVDEYASSAFAARTGRPDRAGRAHPERAELMLLVGEMGRAYRAEIGERKDRLEKLLAAVQATPEQESRIRAIVQNRAELAGDSPSRQSRRKIAEAIRSELTPEQQSLLREFVEKEGGLGAGPRRPAK